MSKVLKINNKDYTFEFTMEASLYSECTEKVTLLMLALEGAEGESDIKSVLTGISDIPMVALTMFHAGLLEHHGEECKTISDSKQLVKQYILEHKEDETGNFYGIMNTMLEIMSDDGFFDLIGLNQMFQTVEKEVKKPQDHKKKTTKKIETIEK